MKKIKEKNMSLENQMEKIDLRNNLSFFNKENDCPKTEPDPGYHWERVNRYKLYKACNSGYHKGKWRLYFSSSSLDSCKEVAADVNKDLYDTKIVDAGKTLWVQRLIY